MKLIKGSQGVSRHALLITLLVGGSGCAPATPEDIREMEQLLATGFGGPDPRFLQPWDSPGEVDVCFVARTGQEGLSDYAAAKEVVMTTIQRTWEASSGLTFDFRGDCPSVINPDWLSIYLDVNQSGGGRGAYAGKGARLSPGTDIENRTDIQVYMGAGLANPTLPILTAHELGHTLGFYHEMERVENDGDDCFDAAGNPILGQNNAFGHFTPYDENSVMLWSYCATPSPNRTNEAPISRLDALARKCSTPRPSPSPLHAPNAASCREQV